MGMLDFLFSGDDKKSSGTVVENSDSGQKGGGLFTDAGFYKSLLEAGVGLAGTYFQLSNNKKLAEDAAKQRMAEIAAMAKKGGGGGGGGGAGAAMAIARMNNLNQLYQNWAQLTQRGGEALGQSVADTARLAQAPINIRAGRL